MKNKIRGTTEILHVVQDDSAVALARKPPYNRPMIRQYERYVFFHLLWPVLLITCVLTGIIWLTQILRFVDFILNRGLGLDDFFYLTGLMLPALLLVILPIALGIAVIYTINRLTTDSELIVLHAVGVSKLQLMRPILAMGAACTLICYGLSLYLMPLATAQFHDIRALFRDQYASVLLEEEVFNSPVDGLTVFVRQRDSMNTLYGILLHDNRNEQETVTLTAESGKVQQTPTGPRFYLERGVRQTLRNGRVSWLSFDHYTLDVNFYAQTEARRRSPDERTITELFNTDDLADKEARTLRAEGHYRITWPAFNLALPLAALAVLFSGHFSRRGQWWRMLGAAVTMIGVMLLYFTCRSLGIKYEAVQFSLYAIMLLTCAIALYVIALEKFVTVPKFRSVRFTPG